MHSQMNKHHYSGTLRLKADLAPLGPWGKSVRLGADNAILTLLRVP